MTFEHGVIDLNHHAAAVVPYYRDREGTRLILERKSWDYFPPKFDRSLCFIGGNSTPLDEKAGSPLETAIAEVRDDFAIRRRHVPQPFGMRAPPDLPLTNAERTLMHEVGSVLTGDLHHFATYIVSVDLNPPTGRFGFSVFGRRLEPEEVELFTYALASTKGKITVQNRAHDSKIEDIPLEAAAQDRWAWGYDRVLWHLRGCGFLDGPAKAVRRFGRRVSVTPLLFGGALPGDRGPTYEELRDPRVTRSHRIRYASDGG